MFIKNVLREIRLTLIQIKESRFWGLWVLALIALGIWYLTHFGKG